MAYSAFVQVTSQLLHGGKTSIFIEDRLIHVQRDGDEWIFSTEFQGEAELHRFVQGNLFFRLDAATQSVYIMRKVKIPWNRYLPFRAHLNSFLEDACAYGLKESLSLTQ